MGTTSGAIQLDTTHMEDRIVRRVTEAAAGQSQDLQAAIEGLRLEVRQLREALAGIQQDHATAAPVSPAPAVGVAQLGRGPSAVDAPVPEHWSKGQADLYRYVIGYAHDNGVDPATVMRAVADQSHLDSWGCSYEGYAEVRDAVLALDPGGVR